MNSSAVQGATTAVALVEEGARVRAALASKRFDTLLRLFDFLLGQSLKDRPAGGLCRDRELYARLYPRNRNDGDAISPAGLTGSGMGGDRCG